MLINPFALMVLAYLSVAALVVAMTLWKAKGVRRKLLFSGFVIAIFAIWPMSNYLLESRQDAKAQSKLSAATSHFEMRCKSAGEKIARTVENVEGVVWMKWRDKQDNLSDQFKLDDPFGRDCGAEDCIEQLLRLDTDTGRFEREVTLRKGRYRFVESVDPADGKIYRYTGTMNPGRSWTAEAIDAHRKKTGAEIPDTAYQFRIDKRPLDKLGARYGVTWDDISTREDREMWIAGGSIKVIDLQTNEVIAERIGYMMDRGLGSTGGFRSPWPMALRNACPPFPSDGGQSTRSWPQTETLLFASKVLQPNK